MTPLTSCTWASCRRHRFTWGFVIWRCWCLCVFWYAIHERFVSRTRRHTTSTNGRAFRYSAVPFMLKTYIIHRKTCMLVLNLFTVVYRWIFIIFNSCQCLNSKSPSLLFIDLNILIQDQSFHFLVVWCYLISLMVLVTHTCQYTPPIWGSHPPDHMTIGECIKSPNNSQYGPPNWAKPTISSFFIAKQNNLEEFYL